MPLALPVMWTVLPFWKDFHAGAQHPKHEETYV